MMFAVVCLVLFAIDGAAKGQVSLTERIPSEVLQRFGGLTEKQKRDLFKQFQSLNFVHIPEFLKSQVQSIYDLYKFGVCKTPSTANNIAASYFVCPSLQSSPTTPFEEQLRYCCGAVDQQFCCTSSAFMSGIRIVTSDLGISPSIVMGISLGFLLLCTLIAILAYTRIAKNLRRESTKLQHYSTVDSGVGVVYGSKSTFGSYPVPPRKQLLSDHSTNIIIGNEPYSVESAKLAALSNADKKALEVLKRKQVATPTREPILARSKGNPPGSQNTYTVQARPTKRSKN